VTNPFLKMSFSSSGNASHSQLHTKFQASAYFLVLDLQEKKKEKEKRKKRKKKKKKSPSIVNTGILFCSGYCTHTSLLLVPMGVLHTGDTVKGLLRRKLLIVSQSCLYAPQE